MDVLIYYLILLFAPIIIQQDKELWGKVDNLLRPCADLGLQEDSLIEWRYDVEKQIDHIVLGKGPPGGAWPTFPGAVRALSPGSWLSLPPHSTLGTSERPPARAVAAYCRRYVRVCGLQRFFRTGTVVTHVGRGPRTAPPCRSTCPRNANYWVSGYDKSSGRGFRYACRGVVLACGAGDRPNTLSPHVATHTVQSLDSVERAVHVLGERGDARALIVGSGVSAADAVRLCRAARVSAAHAHRAPPDALTRLPPRDYPEYAHVYQMMLDGPSGNHPYYRPYPDHVIVEITPIIQKESPLKLKQEEDETLTLKRVKLLNLVTNETTEITVSLIAALIGSKPDLFFLQTNFNINNMDVQTECIKCVKKKEKDNQRQCFLRNHWHYIKTVLGQSIQICKSRYLNYSEINGNTDTKCVLPDCNKRKCMCNIKAVCKCEFIPINNCQCFMTNPFSDGLGFGLDPKKPVDGRSNPIAIDKGTHEVLNAPKGLYALGPLTADNFIRFIPGGAVALVAQIHREMKE